MELHLGSGIPSLLATLYWGGFLVGRFVSTFFRNFNPRKILIVTTIIASVLIIISIYTENLWFLAAVGLFHSVMWSCIFTLSTRGLREYTSKASGVFMMGVFGGAVFPVAQGFLSDLLCSWQYTWSIALICEIVMLLYGLYGYHAKREMTERPYTARKILITICMGMRKIRKRYFTREGCNKCYYSCYY